MYNRVVLIGRFTSDPELKATPNGISVCSFTIACDRRFSSRDSDQQKADFIPCVAWRTQAEFVSKYFSKGDAVGVEGTLQVRSYDDKTGAKRFVTEVLVDRAFFVGSKASSSKSNFSAMSSESSMATLSNGSFADFEEMDPEDDIPF